MTVEVQDPTQDMRHRPYPVSRIPVLERLSHDYREAVNDHKMCIMEWVCILSGEAEFTDMPGCTDAYVSLIAQMVNDRIYDDSARQKLLGFAADLQRCAPLDAALEAPRRQREVEGWIEKMPALDWELFRAGVAEFGHRPTLMGNLVLSVVTKSGMEQTPERLMGLLRIVVDGHLARLEELGR
jgi:hypothetical protein